MRDQLRLEVPLVTLAAVFVPSRAIKRLETYRVALWLIEVVRDARGQRELALAVRANDYKVRVLENIKHQRLSPRHAIPCVAASVGLGSRV